jgi:cellulose synthase/poly-beta-1,6-N-acetylglucosamine synthase-like glycosyltransferase
MMLFYPICKFLLFLNFHLEYTLISRLFFCCFQNGYLIFIFLVFIYAIVFLFLAIFWNKKEHISSNYIEVPVSIIIPFRNEAIHLKSCIENIINQNYNQQVIEIICVNDHSTDNSLDVLNSFKQIKIISLNDNQSGKKTALKIGIEAATHECIIFRDADTYAEQNWLISLTRKFSESNADLIIAPIKYKTVFSFLAALQILENLAITYTGAAMAKLGKPILCNGANLMLKKSAFSSVNGFANHEHISSGDDVFLLNSFMQSNKKIEYVNSSSAAVICEPEKNISSLINQRIRWASKNKHNKNPYNFFMAFLIVFVNVGLLTLGIMVLFHKNLLPILYWYVLFKFIIDALVVTQSAIRFKQLTMLCWLPVFFCVFPLEIIIILTLTLVILPEWKGRKISN